MACADARHIPLADESVQCVVTSPPYWGLRKYAGNQDLIWDDDSQCGHQFAAAAAAKTGGLDRSFGYTANQFVTGHSAQACIHCGAWKGAFGLEPGVEMYVSHSMQILREIRRALRGDGVCFWNIGDSYYNGDKGGYRNGRVGAASRIQGNHLANDFIGAPNRQPQVGLKPKDIVLMPSRIALAAQADGWWVRSMIVWAKPNPMPESVTDRPTDAYEHIIMLTKSERYFWDQDAVREPATDPGRKNWENHTRRSSERDDARPPGAGAHTLERLDYRELGRNLRNVWNFATQPYSGAHFATFPEELPRRCILAASKPGDVILDPFAGSGTTGRIAVSLQRKAVLLDLAYTHDYGPLAKARTSRVQIEAFA